MTVWRTAAMNAPRSCFWSASVVLAMLATAGAQPQTPQAPAVSCSAYQGYVSSAAVVPRALLKDWEIALPCLVRSIDEIGRNISSVRDANNASRQLISAASASVVILDENKQPAVTLFRLNDNLRVITTMAFGARSGEQNLRVNATRVLGDVLDNTSLCVVLDHLLDPEISINGRANLLAAVLSVVSWSTNKESLDNIERMLDNLGSIPQDLTHTVTKIGRLRTEIEAQRKMPSSSNEDLSQCRVYVKRWAGDKIKY